MKQRNLFLLLAIAAMFIDWLNGDLLATGTLALTIGGVSKDKKTPDAGELLTEARLEEMAQKGEQFLHDFIANPANPANQREQVIQALVDGGYLSAGGGNEWGYSGDLAIGDSTEVSATGMTVQASRAKDADGNPKPPYLRGELELDGSTKYVYVPGADKPLRSKFLSRDNVTVFIVPNRDNTGKSLSLRPQ